MPTSTPTSFKLNKEDRARLRILALSRGQSMTSVVRQLLRSEYRLAYGLTAPDEALKQALRGMP